MSNQNLYELSTQELDAFLQKHPEWKVMGDHNFLVRVYNLKSYFKGLNFLQNIGWQAQKHNHHPDLTLTFSQLTCSLTTHDIGNKISNRDIFFAELIEKSWF